MGKNVTLTEPMFHQEQNDGKIENAHPSHFVVPQEYNNLVE